MENPFEEEKQGSGRPTLLTVLCILTFIGSGFVVLSALVMFFMPGSFLEGMQSQFTDMLGEEKAEEVIASMTLASKLAPFQLIFGILSLVGAVMMFQLKRIGFFLYVIAQVLILLLPVFMGGQCASIVWPGFWTLLFIVLYAVNWKSLK